MIILSNFFVLLLSHIPSVTKRQAKKKAQRKEPKREGKPVNKILGLSSHVNLKLFSYNLNYYKKRCLQAVLVWYVLVRYTATLYMTCSLIKRTKSACINVRKIQSSKNSKISHLLLTFSCSRQKNWPSKGG